MKGEPQVIERLNEALFLELGAVNQYWVHYRLLEDWGYQKLAKKERAESIEEMHHADRLIERIIFLEGHPNLQKVGPLRVGQNVKEVLEADLAGEYDARTSYKQYARNLPAARRLRDDEAVRGPAGRRGRPYRLPRDAARPPEGDRRGKVRPAQCRAGRRRRIGSAAHLQPFANAARFSAQNARLRTWALHLDTHSCWRSQVG